MSPDAQSGKLSEGGRLVRGFLREPVEGLLNLHARVAERKEIRATRKNGVGGFMPWPPCPYEVDENWEQRIHEFAGSPWPCSVSDEFWEMWPLVMGSLEEKGFELGRGAFGGWGDGEPGLVRAVWCLTRHLRPAKVVETGVARGITSRFILEALAQTGLVISGASTFRLRGTEICMRRSARPCPRAFVIAGRTFADPAGAASGSSLLSSERSICSYTTAGIPSETCCSS